jgi:hypothetical protein
MRNYIKLDLLNLVESSTNRARVAIVESQYFWQGYEIINYYWIQQNA